MFNIKQWINEPVKPYDAELDFLNQKVKVRCLRGTDYEQYLKSRQAGYNMFATVIYHGLVNEETGDKFDESEIEELLRRHTIAASALANEIIEMSNRIHEEEYIRFRVAEKNSETLGTIGPTSNGVKSSEKTRSDGLQQEAT